MLAWLVSLFFLRLALPGVLGFTHASRATATRPSILTANPISEMNCTNSVINVQLLFKSKSDLGSLKIKSRRLRYAGAAPSENHHPGSAARE